MVSIAGNVAVTQLVDRPNVGVHVRIPKSILSQGRSGAWSWWFGIGARARGGELSRSRKVLSLRFLLGAAARGSRRPHGDGARVALCVEGGAMRGVVSAGMVSALEALGLTHAFDAVYGSSAGAINAAYFLAGQARLGTTIYYEDINNRAFIDPRRALLGRPDVNLAFLLDDVAVRRKRLGRRRVARAPRRRSRCSRPTSDAHAAVALRDFRDDRTTIARLRAGATMPVVAGRLSIRRPPVSGRVDDRADSGADREADGPTHVLALLDAHRRHATRPSAFDRYFVVPRLRRFSPELASSLPQSRRAVRRAGSGHRLGPGPLGRIRSSTSAGPTAINSSSATAACCGTARPADSRP